LRARGRAVRDLAGALRDLPPHPATIPDTVHDLVCAELCGWGHYKMKGRVTVQTRAEFDEWLEEKWRQQEATQESPATAGEPNKVASATRTEETE